MPARSKTVTAKRASAAPAFDPGALVMVGIQGKVLDAAQAAFLRKNRIRAVVLFRGNLGSELVDRFPVLPAHRAAVQSPPAWMQWRRPWR